MKNKNHGFTLVELLITMSIMLVIAAILIGIIDPAALIGKARDSRRKSDLSKLKIAFEEYYNDKGMYPSNVALWNIESNCGKTIIVTNSNDGGNTDIGKYIKSWPCDPNGSVYKMKVISNQFKVVTNLENKTDKDIIQDWYTSNKYILDPGITNDSANYGVSSSNVYWYDVIIDPSCDTTTCSAFDSNGCGSTGRCSGGNCYYGRACSDSCQTNECP